MNSPNSLNPPNPHHPRTLLVTGGAGFIGSNFIRYLLATDPSVVIVNLDLLTYAGSLDNLAQLPDPQRHYFIQGDITDRKLVDKILRDFAIDTLIHFAAESHVDRSIQGPAAFIQTNVVGTFTLLEAARQYWLTESPANPYRFVHISTDEVYGTLQPDDPPFTELTAYAPNSPYSASKAASDHLVRAYFQTYGLPTVTTHCSNNYGPYQHGEKFIPTIIQRCFHQKPIPIYGDGSHLRDWLYVEDHCRAIDSVMRYGQLGERYNIGGNNEWANRAIAEWICQIMDEIYPKHRPHHRLMTFVTDRPGHDWRYAIDAKKIRTELNWQPQETFATGLQKTVVWYLQHFQAW